MGMGEWDDDDPFLVTPNPGSMARRSTSNASDYPVPQVWRGPPQYPLTPMEKARRKSMEKIVI